MDTVFIEREIDPCSPPSAIREWIDELLELRFAFARIPGLVREIDAELRVAVHWMKERNRPADCL